MKLSVLAVGRIREAPLRAVADDYAARIRRYTSFEEIEVKSDAHIARAIVRGATLVACEVDGQATTSEGFAEKLDGWLGSGKGLVVFIIGGAEGIPAEISARADARLSLSRMTLPHRLARVVLFEQIYRAFTILRGEPYARE